MATGTPDASLAIHASTIRIRLDGTTGISRYLADGEYDVALCNEL